MSDTSLLVPIHVDALCLAAPQDVMEAMADYTTLPYQLENTFSNDSTFNDGTLNIVGESVLTPLFSTGLSLGAGIHLHWALPDALTSGSHGEDGSTFPVVPNRWLILRQGGSLPEKQWVVESDYLYPVIQDANEPPPNAINILMDRPDLATVDPADPTTYQYQRYRYTHILHLPISM